MKRRAFSLLELLIVIVVISILMVMAGGAYNSVAESLDVSNGLQQVSDTLNLARQISVSRNQYSQVRFFKVRDASDPRNGHCVAMALYSASSPFYGTNATSAQLRQEGPIARMPLRSMLVSDSANASLFQALSADPSPVRTGTARLADGRDYDWVAFYFKPDGSMDLGATNLLNLSVCSPMKYAAAQNQMPANYGILALDPCNGRTMLVRP